MDQTRNVTDRQTEESAFLKSPPALYSSLGHYSYTSGNPRLNWVATDYF